jgi:hypothetical protein
MHIAFAKSNQNLANAMMNQLPNVVVLSLLSEAIPQFTFL